MKLRQILRASLLVGALWLAACGRDGEQVAVPTVADGMGPAEAVVPGTTIAAPAERPDGMETERWSGEIQAVLDAIKAALLGHGQAPPVAPGFAATTLLPQELEDVVRGRVRRLPAGVVLPRADSLGDSLAALRSAFLESEPQHALAKIVRISADEGGGAATLVDFQLDGRAAQPADENLQINAEWACRWTNAGGAWLLRSVELRKLEEVRAPAAAFAEATAAALGHDPVFREQFLYGQDHWVARIEMRLGIDVGGWQGIAVADVDGDGLEDIYVSQPGGLPNRLYKHRPDGTLEDISAEAGVDWLEVTHGSLFADLDNDSDADLIVGLGDGILIMANDGTGKFKAVATKLMTDGLPYSIASADIDQDGDLDLYVCGYSARAGVSRHHVFARPVPYHDANNGGRNALFRNDGGWRFTDVTRATGLAQNNTRFSYAASWEDYDLDGDLDLYVANDFGRNNLYRNELIPGGRVRFNDVAEEAGVVDVAAGMSVCWGDYDNDGRADLYVGNMFSSAGNRIATQPVFLAAADAETRAEFLHHAGGNSLFRNLGDGKFADVGAALGENLGRWAWSSKFADLDNDGWLDIVVANGFITQEDTGDL